MSVVLYLLFPFAYKFMFAQQKEIGVVTRTLIIIMTCVFACFAFYNFAPHYYDMLDTALGLRDNLKVVILSHIENLGDTLNPQWKLKTAGKMLDTQLNVDGLFTYILYTEVVAGEDGKPSYKFRTNTLDGSDTCKTPMGCFNEVYTDNDLNFILTQIDKYNNED
jgi:hypothetical protein